MRIPQTAERIKEAPAQALRAVFAGVGQVLLITERVRRRSGGEGQDAEAGRETEGASRAETSGSAVVPDEGGQAAGADGAGAGSSKMSTSKAGTKGAGTAKASTTKASTTKASTTKTSTTKTSTTKTSAAKASATKASTTKASASKPAEAKGADTKAPEAKASEAEASSGAAPAGAPDTSALPLPHYSELSIASLRARMRGLDVAQVRQLIGYERTHEDRANVISMFERRIAKLEEGAGADTTEG
jgi:cytoskeletal protein RodZ